MYLEAGDFVSSSEVFGIGGGTSGRGTHSVLVILTYEYNRKVPELSLQSDEGSRKQAGY